MIGIRMGLIATSFFYHRACRHTGNFRLKDGLRGSPNPAEQQNLNAHFIPVLKLKGPVREIR